MRTYKQGDNSNDVIFYMVDNTDHVTPKTGLTLTVKVKKNGAGFVAGAGTTTEIEDGLYKYVPAVAEMGTLGPILFKATATGADNCVIEGVVVAYDPYSTYFGISKINSLKDSWNDPTAAECKADLTTLEGRLTAARAGYLDNLNISGNVASAGGLSAVNSNLSNINSVTLPAIEGKIDIIDEFVDGIVDELDTTPLATLSTFDPTTDGVIVTTNNDKTGYSISGTKTTLDDLNDIDGSSVVASNMRGTDNALLATNYTAPDNTKIEAIQTLLTNEVYGNAALKTLIDAISANTDDLADGQRLDLLIDAIKTAVDFSKNVAEGDSEIDLINSQFIIKLKGTDTVLIRKDITDSANAPVTSTNTVIVKSQEPI